MPREDQTGPAGMGPKTGRGMGRCVTPAGSRSAGLGYGGRRGGGRGLGWNRLGRYYPIAASSKKEEAERLSAEADIIEKELKDIKNRLAELDNQK